MSDRVQLGVVLAGGAARRFGGAKAAHRFGGSTLAERAALALDPWCGRVVVSVRRPGESPAPGRPTVSDGRWAGHGPLAGLVAAGGAEPPETLVLACDYPALDHAALGALLEPAVDPAVAIVLAVDGRGRDHPLVALWRGAAILEAARLLEAGERRVGAVVERLAVRRVPLPDAALRNVNRRADLPPD